MSHTGETLIVAEPDIELAPVRAAVPTERSRTLWLNLGVPAALAGFEESEPALLLVATTQDSAAALELVAQARERRPDCPIVVLYAGTPNGFMSRAFESGVDDLVALPQGLDALSFAFEKAITRRRGTASASELGEMVCIVGPKGGTGKTLTACNLAVALAKAGAHPVLVDIDLQFGDVGLALGLTPEHTIYDLARASGPIDPETVRRFVTSHDSGADVLVAPLRPDQAAAVDADLLRELYDALRQTYDYVIVDTPPSFSAEVIATIDASTHLCVVGMLDALSLKDTKLGLETLALMGRDEVTLVLNRADTSVGISKDDVAAILGRAPDILVPSDRAIPRAITNGQAIVTAAEKSGPAQAFTRLADLYLLTAGSRAGGATTNRSRGLLRRAR